MLPIQSGPRSPGFTFKPASNAHTNSSAHKHVDVFTWTGTSIFSRLLALVSAVREPQHDDFWDSLLLLLLKHGASPNIPCLETGMTPLHLICSDDTGKELADSFYFTDRATCRGLDLEHLSDTAKQLPWPPTRQTVILPPPSMLYLKLPCFIKTFHALYLSYVNLCSADQKLGKLSDPFISRLSLYQDLFVSSTIISMCAMSRLDSDAGSRNELRMGFY